MFCVIKWELFVPQKKEKRKWELLFPSFPFLPSIFCFQGRNGADKLLFWFDLIFLLRDGGRGIKILCAIVMLLYSVSPKVLIDEDS